MERNKRLGAITFLLSVLGGVVILTIVEWQWGLFFASLAAAFLAGAWPLAFASRLVARMWEFRDARLSRWAGLRLVLIALLIASGVAATSYAISKLMLESVTDNVESPISVLGVGAAMGLFCLSIASITIVPLVFVLSAVGATFRVEINERLAGFERFRERFK